MDTPLKIEPGVTSKKKFTPNVALGRVKPGGQSRPGPDLTKEEAKKVKAERKKPDRYDQRAEPAKTTMAPNSACNIKSIPSRGGGGVGGGPSGDSKRKQGKVKSEFGDDMTEGWWEENAEVLADGGVEPVVLPFMPQFSQMAVEADSVLSEDSKAWFDEAEGYEWGTSKLAPPMMCIQLPSHFPLSGRYEVPEEEEVRDQGGTAPLSEMQKRYNSSVTKLFQSQHSIKTVPEGRIGTLVFYKSGRVELRLVPPASSGDDAEPAVAPPPSALKLGVHLATPFLFHQELLAVHPETSQAHFLGPLKNRFVTSISGGAM